MTTSKIAARGLAAIGIAAVLSACGESGSGDDSADLSSNTIVANTSQATTTTASTAPTTVATVKAEAPTDPVELAQFAALRETDFPADYEIDTSITHGEPCDGRSGVAEVHPANAESSFLAEGLHLHSSGILVYPSEAAANAAFDYASETLAVCNDAISTDEAGDETYILTEQFAPPSLAGTDRLAGFRILMTADDAGVIIDSNLALLGRTIFTASSTDPETATEMTRVMLDRLQGASEDASIRPAGAAETTPGLNHPEFYSWPAAAADVRALALPEGRPADWIEAATDERIDAVASESCAAVNALEIGDSLEVIDAAIIGVFTEAEVAVDQVEDLGFVAGASMQVYCPGLAVKISDLLDAAQ